MFGKPFASGGVHGAVAGGHGGGVADDGVKGAVAGEFCSYFFGEGISHVGGDGWRHGVEIQRIEVHANYSTLAFEKHPVGVERPATWSRTYV